MFGDQANPHNSLFCQPSDIPAKQQNRQNTDHFPEVQQNSQDAGIWVMVTLQQTKT